MTTASAQFSIVDLNDIITSSIAPKDPNVNTCWLDTNSNVLKVWNGNEWVIENDWTKPLEEAKNGLQSYTDKVAEAKADLVKQEAIAYVDGVVTEEEKKRIAEAEKNLEAALKKADEASQNAKNDAKSYTDSKISDVNETLNKTTSEVNVLKDQIDTKVSQKEVNNVVETINETIKDIKNSTSSNTSEIKQVKDSITASVNSLNTKTETINNNINNINSELTKKIDSNLSTAKSYADTSSNNAKADAIKQADINTTNKISDIQIGGRNLIKNSKDLNNKNYYFLGSNNTKEIVTIKSPLEIDDTAIKLTTSKSTNNEIFRLNYVVKKTGVYTFSCWYKSAVNDNQQVHFDICDQTTNNQNCTATQEWKELIITSTISRCDETYNFVDIEVAKGNSVIIYNPKLEIGTKATDYTPAPEDVQNEIKSTQDTIADTTNKLNQAKIDLKKYSDDVAKAKADLAQASAIANADGKISAEEKKRIDEAKKNLDAAIAKATEAESNAKAHADQVAEQKKNEAIKTANTYTTAQISTTNDNLNKATSEINVLKGQLSTKVGQTDIDKAISNIKLGGRNLIPNSYINADTSDYGAFGRTLTVDLQEGETYCFSIRGHIDKVASDSSKTLTCFIYEDTWSYGCVRIDISSVGINQTRYNLFTPKKTGIYKFATYMYPSDGSRLGKVTLEWAKLEKGTKPTDWTPAPEDLNQAIIDSANKTDEKINTVETELQQTKESFGVSIKDLNSKTSTMETNITNTTKTLDTKINAAKTDAINSALNSAKAEIDSAKAYAEKVAKDNSNLVKDQVVNDSRAYTNEQIGAVNNNVNNIKNTTDLLARGLNKWIFKAFDKGSLDNSQSPDIGMTIGRTLLWNKEINDTEMSSYKDFGSNYLGYCKTNVYLDSAYSWNTSLRTDDAGSVYLNGSLVEKTSSCVAKNLTMQFKQGWNTIEVLWLEGGGGDGFNFGSNISSLPQIKVVNAYNVADSKADIGYLNTDILNKYNSSVDHANNIAEQKKNEAISSANSHADSVATSKSNDAKNQAISSANSYTNTAKQQAIDSANSHANNIAEAKKNEAISQANKDTDTKINNIQIGGRNLVKNSNFIFGGDNWCLNNPGGNAGFITEADSTFGKCVKVTAHAPNQGMYCQPQRKPNTYYSWSAWMKANTNTRISISHEGGDGSQTFDVTTEWKKYTGSGIWRNGGALCFYPQNNQDIIFYITNVKYEEGTKSSDWTPAPEDVELNINAAKQQAIEESTAKATEAENKAKKYADDVAVAKANLAQTMAQSYVDGKVSTEEKARIKQAQDNLDTAVAKAEEAKNEAIAQAEKTAEAKVNLAKAYADDVASKKAELARQQAIADADGKVSIEEKARIKQAQDNLNAAISKASAAESNARNYANQVAEQKKNEAITGARNIPDTRNDNQPPKWYMSNYPRQTITEFKTASNIGISGTTYGTLETKVPWNDASGGYPVQTFRSSSTPTYQRKGINQDSWSAWEQIEDTQGSQNKSNTAQTNAINSANGYTNSQISAVNTAMDKKNAEIKATTDSIASRVSSTESNIVKINGNVSNLQSRMNSAEQKITNTAIINTVKQSNEYKSDLNSKANRSDVYSKSEVESKLTQTNNSITATFSRSGGYNRILNSTGYDKTKGWNLHEYNLKGSDLTREFDVRKDTWTNYETCLQARIANMSSGEFGFSQTFDTVVGQKYILTALIAGHRSKKQIVVRNSNGGWIASAYYGEITGGENIGNWVKVSLSFTATTRTSSIEFDITSSTSADSYFWAKQIMVTEGDVVLPWTQNPTEVYTGITTIDKDGIRINNTQSDTYTEINSESFAVNDNKGGTVAEFSQNSIIPSLQAGVINANVVNAANVLSKSSNDDMVFYVQGNYGVDSDERDGSSWNQAFKTVQYVLDTYLDDCIVNNITIYIGGSVPGWRLNSKIGRGYLKFVLYDDVVVNGLISFDGITNKIYFYGGTKNVKCTLKNGLEAYRCGYIDIQYINFVGSNSKDSNVYFSEGTNGCVRNCDGGSSGSLVKCGWNSMAKVFDNIGSNLNHYIHLDPFGECTGISTGSNKCPDYKYNLVDTTNNGGTHWYMMSGSYNKTPSKGFAPSYTASGRTGRWTANHIWSDETLHGWSNRSELIQGYCSSWGTGRWTGYIQWKDSMSGIRNTISGGTNLSGTLKVKRRTSSGSSVGYCYAYASDGTSLGSVKVGYGGVATFNLNSSIVSKIQSGAIKYFYLKNDSNNASTYMKMETWAELTINYTK